MAMLVELAERHRDWPMPGYTHLQRAQPVYLSHHLLAYFWMFRRDLRRFGRCLDEAPSCRWAPARWPASTGAPAASRSPTSWGSTS